MIFHWSLSDSKFPQVSRTLLSILADVNNAVVWTVSSHPVISKSSSRKLVVFPWSLNDSKSAQVSRTLLSILANLNNAVVWIVCIRPVIFKSSSPFNNPSVTVLRAPTTTGINVTFMFHNFFYSLARSEYLSFFPVSFTFTLLSAGTSKLAILQVFSFCWLL